MVLSGYGTARGSWEDAVASDAAEYSGTDPYNVLTIGEACSIEKDRLRR
jgi:hypothetical protein